MSDYRPRCTRDDFYALGRETSDDGCIFDRESAWQHYSADPRRYDDEASHDTDDGYPLTPVAVMLLSDGPWWFPVGDEEPTGFAGLCDAETGTDVGWATYAQREASGRTAGGVILVDRCGDVVAEQDASASSGIRRVYVR